MAEALQAFRRVNGHLHTRAPLEPKNLSAPWAIMIRCAQPDAHRTAAEVPFSRCEVFGDTDVEAALAKFEELHPQTRRLKNAASRAYVRLSRYFAARDWAAMAETIAEDILDDDRRRVVNHGPPPRIKEYQIANNSVAVSRFPPPSLDIWLSTPVYSRGRPEGQPALAKIHHLLCRRR